MKNAELYYLNVQITYLFIYVTMGLYQEAQQCESLLFTFW